MRTLGGDIYNQQTDCIEMSILEKPLKTLGQKQSIYDLDQLDDEALSLIMRPERKVKITHQVVKEEPPIAGA